MSIGFGNDKFENTFTFHIVVFTAIARAPIVSAAAFPKLNSVSDQ
jgi:hypothetical protein